MDRNFARALSLALQSEGGWSDNAADPGGATMKGVTLATFRAFIKPGGSKADLRAITDEQISTCYRKQYWDAINGDALPDGVDYAVFDFAVNSGPGRAARYLQAVLGVVQDGRIGPATLAAARAKPTGVVIDTLCDARLAFLERLPTWSTFGKGWSARVASVRRQALLMSAQPEASAQPSRPPASLSPASVSPASRPPEGRQAAGASTGVGDAPAAKQMSSGRAAATLALIAVALGSVVAWAAHLPCNLLGAFCQ